MRPEHQASDWGREVSRAVTPKIGRWVFPARPLAVPLCVALGFLSVFKPSFTALCRRCVFCRLKVCGKPLSRNPITAILPTA